MIQNLVTIIIPSSDSLFRLKSTMESLVFQTRINGTRVLVADMGSSDGSIQYAAQLTSDLRGRLKVEPFDLDKDMLSVYSNITTPYVFYISPGKTFQDKDFLMDNLNRISGINEVLVYTEDTFLKSILNTLIHKKRNPKNVGLLVKKENVYDVSFTKENDNIFVNALSDKKKTIKI